MAFIRSISGIRATLGDDLTPTMVAEYASAFAAYLPEGVIAVGRDGRPSGAWIENIVCGTLSACGRKVLVLGSIPTPTVQLFAEMENVAGGISITASHNPAPWNGMKFFNGRGLYLNAEENAAFWHIADKRLFSFVPRQHGGAIVSHADPSETHIDSILRLPVFTKFRDVIRAQKFRVVVDAVNCSGSEIMPELLTHLGCEVVPLYCDSSGEFPHTPEPLPENLSALSQAVLEHKADIGIAIDPDADRLVLVDEQGNTVHEENTIVLAVKAALSNKAEFTIVGETSVIVNLSTTQAVEDVAAMYGAITMRTPVGEINVVKAMLASGSLIGGEGSGGVIVPACHAGRDSLVGAALVLLLMAQEKLQKPHQTLSAIVAELPRYAMVKYKKDFTGSPQAIFHGVTSAFPNAIVSMDDGLRLSFGSSWLHLRTSNTEPIIRIIAEAQTHEEADALAKQCMAHI